MKQFVSYSKTAGTAFNQTSDLNENKTMHLKI